MPAMLKMNHTRIARNAGIAMREVAGKFRNGMMPKMLQTSRNVNIEVRNGT